MKFKYFIFDWDGTVMDSADKIVMCMQKAAIRAELPVPSSDAVKHIIGISLKPAIVQLFNIDSSKADEVVEHYKHIFIAEDQTPCPLFSGAKDTLKRLSQQNVLAVATGKARRGLERAWENTESKQFFDTSRCADEAESKPSSDMLEQIIAHWNIEAEQAVMIGDTVYDMQMAENIGMPRIAVSYGVHSKEALATHKPLAIINNFSELLSFS